MRFQKLNNKLLLLSLVLFVVSCSNNDNSLCEYTEINFKADVVEITSKGNKYDVLLSFNNSHLYKENQSLSALKKIDIDSNFIQRNHISVGKTFTGIVSETDDSSCEKFYISFNQRLK